MNFLDYYTELEKVNSFYDEINEHRNRLSKPTLTDFSFIPTIRKIVYRTKYSEAEKRKVFVCIVLFLYAPTALLKSTRMPNNLRNSIAKFYTGRKPCSISRVSKNLLIEYKVYKEFRNEVDTVFLDVVKELQLNINYKI